MFMELWRRWMYRRAKAKCNSGVTVEKITHLAHYMLVDGLGVYTPAMGTYIVHSTRYKTVEGLLYALDKAIYCIKNGRYVKGFAPPTEQEESLRLDDFLVDKEELAYDYPETIADLVNKIKELNACLITVEDEAKVKYYRRHVQVLAEEAYRLLVTTEQVRTYGFR